MRRDPLPDNVLDKTDRLIINTLQDGFPLTAHPFSEMAGKIGLSEAELIKRLVNLRELGVITRFGPLYDVEAMGGAFCLCAIAVPAEQFEEVMTKVNAHPEVAHNYERNHHLNMWFVLATEHPEGISDVAGMIEAETGLKVLQFPKQEEFFIGFRVTA
ncbi:MAG: Lrp/AsnC family transcriptional regulator [Amylibacter sp.]|nr:Lrp/AsnC family transcriptional regulator [Amylibacter sp.]